MARRRTRYELILERDGIQRTVHALAYDPSNVLDHYNRRGYNVVSLKPYRRAAATVTRNPVSAGTWTVDDQAIQDACLTLGIKLPVKVRLHGRVGSTNGNHRFPGSYHNIMIKSYLSPEQATKTLWHELTHAMQAERAGDLTEWIKVTRDQRGHYSYRNRPIEVEARAMSAHLCHISLVKS